MRQLTSEIPGLELELELSADDYRPRSVAADAQAEVLFPDEEVADSDDQELSEEDAELALELAHEDDSANELDDEEQELAEAPLFAEPDAARFGERFYEIALREFESPDGREDEIQRVLREMEQEYFFSRLVRGAKRLGGRALKAGVKLAAKHIPGGNVVAQLASGNLRGTLGALANTAMSALSSHPAIAAALPIIKSLGFSPGKGGADNPDAWNAFAKMSQDAFGQLAQTLPRNVTDPVMASREAGRAFEVAVQRAKARGANGTPGKQRGTRVIRLQRGQRLVIKVR